MLLLSIMLCSQQRLSCHEQTQTVSRVESAVISDALSHVDKMNPRVKSPQRTSLFDTHPLYSFTLAMILSLQDVCHAKLLAHRSAPEQHQEGLHDLCWGLEGLCMPGLVQTAFAQLLQ